MHMINIKSKYYYTRLSGESRRIYDCIYTAWANRVREPTFNVNPLSKKVDVQKIIKFIHWDNPGLFYVDFSKMMITGSLSKTTIQSKFILSDKQIDDAERQLHQIIQAILSASQLSGRTKMDAYQREIALHDMLIKKISYDHSGISDTNTTIVGGLLHKKAVCEGYAKTFRLLCDRVRLSCIYIPGTAEPYEKPRENHSWNIVKLDGVCSHVDVTWDSTMRVGSGACYDHFNLTDDDICRDHEWDRALAPRCSSTANNFFYRSGCIVRNDNELRDIIVKHNKIGCKNFHIMLAYGGFEHVKLMQKINDILSNYPSSGSTQYETLSVRYNPVRKIAEVILS